MKDVLVYLISAILTISFVIITYEVKISKVMKENSGMINAMSRLSASWNDLAISQKILFDLLKEDYSEEEIDLKYIKKMEESNYVKEDYDEDDYY